MARKRLTQVLPFLIPIRRLQRNLFYQIEMFFDKNHYAKKYGEFLPFVISEEKTLMINHESGYDEVYQKNKVHNLKIVAKTMSSVLLYPGEVFSFYYLSLKSKKYGRFKEGLVLVDGKIVPQKGGGICHLSNLLHLLFLKSPLTVIERHGHKKKMLPNSDKDALEGVDATISNGWLDLKVRNDTNDVYQIQIDFDDDYMYAKLLCEKESLVVYTIKNKDFKYLKSKNKVFESVSVVRDIILKETKKIVLEEKLYEEVVEIGYDVEKYKGEK